MDIAKKSFIMDMDGVIYSENVLIEGAKDFIETLSKRGNKFLFLTNNSRHTPLDLSKKLIKEKKTTAKKVNRDEQASWLVCTTEDKQLCSEITSLLIARVEKFGLKVEIDNSSIRIRGKRKDLTVLRNEILRSFPKRLDRLELEIRKSD